jgi:hypothetical protein
MTGHEMKPVRVGTKRMHVCLECARVWPADLIQNPDNPQCPKVTGVSCNQCGTDIMTEYGALSYGLSTVVSGGYESQHLQDCTHYRFRICERCLVKLFTGFTVPVDVRVYTDGEAWRNPTEDDFQ